MWLVALLVNSNTLDEMSAVWRHICIVLSSPNQNDQYKISISTLSKMADDMDGDPEKTNFVFQTVSVSQKGQCTGSIDGDVSNEYAVLESRIDPFEIDRTERNVLRSRS